MNKACFNDAARRYQNMVYRTALHALGSPQDAEDAVQEVFLRLFQYRGTFESEEHLRRWLLRVTVNYGRDLLKSPWRKRRVSWEETPEIPVFDRPEQAARQPPGGQALRDVYRPPRRRQRAKPRRLRLSPAPALHTDQLPHHVHHLGHTYAPGAGIMPARTLDSPGPLSKIFTPPGKAAGGLV